MEELVEVTVLMEGLMPYAGYTPVMAAVWDTQAAGSMGRIGSPGCLETACAMRICLFNCDSDFRCSSKEQKGSAHSEAKRSSCEGWGPNTWQQSV